MYIPYYIESDKSQYSKSIILLSISLLVTWYLFDITGFTSKVLFSETDIPLFYAGLISSFLHNDFSHAFLNAIGLFIFGTFVSKQFGIKKFMEIFIPPIFFLALLDLLIESHSVGLSGSISALIGFVLVKSPLSKIRFAVILIVKNGYALIPIFWLCCLYIYQDVVGVFSLFTDYHYPTAYWAHLVGYVYGCSFGLSNTSKLSEQIPHIKSLFIESVNLNRNVVIVRITAGFILISGVLNLFGAYQFTEYSYPVFPYNKITYYVFPLMLIIIGIIGALGHKKIGLIYFAAILFGTIFNLYIGFDLENCLLFISMSFLLLQMSEFNLFKKHNKQE